MTDTVPDHTLRAATAPGQWDAGTRPVDGRRPRRNALVRGLDSAC
ncbi:hypothetical protein ABZ319_14115 [Nocardia sp. NPDC005978]